MPAFAATVLQGAALKVVLLLREPAARLWVAFNMYGQYPARYGRPAECGFEFYFGNQSVSPDPSRAVPALTLTPSAGGIRLSPSPRPFTLISS